MSGQLWDWAFIRVLVHKVPDATASGFLKQKIEGGTL